jgi:hypothetical protein
MEQLESMQPRLLVIDACVARAAGGDPTRAGVSGACRRALEAALLRGHSVLMCKAMRDEWDKHQSGFARTWRAGMVARRRMKVFEPAECVVLREALAQLDADSPVRKRVDKDVHVVEAGLGADKTILTADATIETDLEVVCPASATLQEITWVYPCHCCA